MLMSCGLPKTLNRLFCSSSSSRVVSSLKVPTTRGLWPSPHNASIKCRIASSSRNDACNIGPDTEIGMAVAAAIRSLGRLPGQTEEDLVEKLRSNWYNTAADVAAMTQEEVKLIDLPVRLWATIQQALQHEAATTGTRKSSENSSLHELEAALTSFSALHQAAPESPAKQEQHPCLADPPTSARANRPSLQTLSHARDQGQGPRAKADSGLAGVTTLGTINGKTSLAESRSTGDHSSRGPVPADIMERCTPSKTAGGLTPRAAAAAAGGKVPSVRRVPLRDTTPYALQEAKMPPALLAEFKSLEAFCTGVFYGQRVEPIKPISHSVNAKELRGMLGWQLNVKGTPLEQLSLRGLLPSPGREAVSQLMEYQQFRTNRGCNDASHKVTIKACIHLARFLYHDQSQPVTSSGPRGSTARPYQDLPVIQELGRMLSLADKGVRRSAPVADDSKKWLEWGEFLQGVRQLKAEAAGLTPSGVPRVRREVARSLQTYLIFAILSVIPDRQRTLRELELGRTLVKEGDRWLIKHGPDDYKTGKQYGERPPLVIAPFIYPELEAFIDTWRQELNPVGNQLFCKAKSGQPMGGKELYGVFKKAAFRLTGKATNPHLVRDMIVTHLRSQGASESDMESLALYMGHSIAMQRSTYDRRTQAQKVTPAVQLLQDIAGKPRTMKRSDEG